MDDKIAYMAHLRKCISLHETQIRRLKSELKDTKKTIKTEKEIVIETGRY